MKKLFKRIGIHVAFMVALTAMITATSITASAASVHYGNIIRHGRLDEHTGMVVSYGKGVRSYKDSACTQPVSHYIWNDPQDWYDSGKQTSSSINAIYPDTVTVSQSDWVNGKPPDLFRYYWFKLKDFEANTDSASGYFSYSWDENKWYNKLPSKIKYVDEHPGSNGNNVVGRSKTYVSNNIGFDMKKLNKSQRDIHSHNRILMLDGGNHGIVMSGNTPSKYLMYYRNYVKYGYLFDFNWVRNELTWAQACGVNPLKQGKNTIYMAGTDSSANYTLNKATFFYDTKVPTITFSPQNKTDTNPISVIINVTDPGASSGTGSGINHYIYRISSDGGASWGAWSGNKKGAYKVTFSKKGTYKIQVQAWDNAGNTNVNEGGPYVINDSDTNVSVYSSGDYRINTDVITSVKVVNNNSKQYDSDGDETNIGDITPDSCATVSFSIPGITNQTKAFVIPCGGSEYVWFRWHTPSSEQSVSAQITIIANGLYNTKTQTYSVSDIDPGKLPDPKPREKKDPFFTYDSVPDLTNGTNDRLEISSIGKSTSWNEYHVYQVKISKTGYYYNPVYKVNKDGSIDYSVITRYDKISYTYYVPLWKFRTNNYSASLSSSLAVSPDLARNKVAKKINGVWHIRSGSGIKENVSANVSTNNSSAVTGSQNVIGYYPEWGYNNNLDTWNTNPYSDNHNYRLFEMLSGSGGLSSTFDLMPNLYSAKTATSGPSHVHFFPMWFRDGSYAPTTFVFDAWTPCGMLSSQSTDTFQVDGNIRQNVHNGPQDPNSNY